MVRAITLTLTCFFLVFSGCSREKSQLRNIPGHVVDFEGIAHGHGAQRAERYCSECHGPALDGGVRGQPPCLKCHGVRWQETGADEVYAPSDSHTLNFGGYLHHRDVDQVQNICTSCHGADLQGLSKTSPPSCFLCHEQLWTE